jgi:hypothetical protein
MYHDLDTRTIRDSGSKCLTSAIVNWSTIAGHTLGSSKSCAAVIGMSPHGAQVSMLALSWERLLREEHGVTTSSCLSLHLEGDRVRPGWCSSLVCLSNNVPLGKWLTFDGHTLESSKSRTTVVGTSPWIAQVSLASNSDDLTPLDNCCPQSTSSSEPELANQEGLCFFWVQLPPKSALALASFVSSYFIAVSVNMKPSSSSLTLKILVNHLALEHSRATSQERILVDIQSLLTFTLTMSTNIRMCTRQHMLGHEMKLRVKKNVNTQSRMFCCALFLFFGGD